MAPDYRVVKRQAKLTVRFTHEGKVWDAIVEVDEGKNEQDAIDEMLRQCVARLSRDAA